MSPQVSIIVPIYGVERFIAHCAETLMSQTLEDIEYIFVNDCTKDRSMDVLHSVIERHPERYHQIKIIEHTENKGLPAARNTGLEYAQGEYVFHCDADDFVEETMLEEMYNLAKKENTDIVWCDYYETFEKHEKIMVEPCCQSAEEAIQKMLEGTMKYNVWNKLIKRTIYLENKITFLSGNAMGEDLSIIKLFIHAKNIAYLHKAHYHYIRYNTGAMTCNMSNKKIEELRNNVNNLCEYLEKNSTCNWESYCSYLKLWLKFPFLLTNGKSGMYIQWRQWFPTSNKYINSLPKANLRIKLLMRAAKSEQWWFVRLHYWIVLKLIYSIIYKEKKI